MSQLTDHNLTFAGAGVQEFQAIGQFIRIRAATGTLYISADGQPEIEREAGEQINFGASNRRVRVRSLVGQTVKITSSDVSQDDNRAAVSVTTTTTIDPSNNLAGLPAQTCIAAGSVRLAPANANRIRLILKIAADEQDGVWIGGSASSAGNGHFMEPGESVAMGTRAECWAYGNGTEDVTVSVLQEEIL